jgi:sigma-E factor negative regulatory protein RseC
MKERATVIALEDDSVWVETQRQGSCDSCAANKGCGQGLMSRIVPGREHYIRALVDREQRQHLAVGDQVEIVVPDELVLKASLIVYLLPLSMLLLGMFAGAWILPGDPGSIAGGALGLLVGAALVRWHARSVRNDAGVQPRVLALPTGFETLSLET